MVKLHRSVRWSLAFALAAAAHAAEPPQSPACALLSSDEAIVIVNGAPVIGDGGAAQNGYSDCAWSNTGGSAVMSLLYWSPDAFNETDTAEGRYGRIAGALKDRHLPVTSVPDLGEKAMLLDEGSPGLAAYTLIVLSHGAVAQIADRGITRAATLAAASAMVGRMATSEAAAVAEPAAPDPATPALPPSPPDRTPASPSKKAKACGLLSKGDLPEPGFVMEDGGPAADGESACNWQQAKDNIDISLVVRDRDPDGAAYTELPPTSSGADPDPLDGIAEKAQMEASGEDPNASYTIALIAGGRLAILSTFRVERAAALKLATAIGKRL